MDRGGPKRGAEDGGHAAQERLSSCAVVGAQIWAEEVKKVEEDARWGEGQGAYEGPAVAGAQAEDGVEGAVDGGQQAAAAMLVRALRRGVTASDEAAVEAVGIAPVALEQAQRGVLIAVGREIDRAHGRRQAGGTGDGGAVPKAGITDRRRDRCQRVAHLDKVARAPRVAKNFAGSPRGRSVAS